MQLTDPLRSPRSRSARPHGTALLAIKGVHTLIFLGELSAIAWLVVTGLLSTGATGR